MGGNWMNPGCLLRSLLSGVCLAVAVQAGADEPSWRVSLGVGLDSVPKFPGADSQKLIVLPFVGATYGPFFFGAYPGTASLAGIGVNLYRDSHWRLAAALSAGLAERKESDDPRLQGLGDVNRTVSAGAAVAYTQDWFLLSASALTDILNRGQGTLVHFNALGRYRFSERLTLFGGPGLAWADGRYTQTFFGVNAQQSAASGLPEFETHPGLNSVRFALGASYRLTSRWNAGLFGSIARLEGDAASSPITESRLQRFVGAVVSYRFGEAPGPGDPGGFILGQ
ncbi:MAG TPA: MipA/OmpV family protein [Burkholderiales bacterium]